MSEQTNSIVYLISGLGADHRVFQRINFGHKTIKHIPWHTPNYEQSIQSYASELIDKHIDQTKKIQLVGLSFGGLIAQEIAAIIEVKKVILISTMRTRKELPFKFKALGKMPFYDTLMNPHQAIKIGIKARKKQFALQTEEGNALAKTIMEDTDPVFLKWAIKKIIHWNAPSPDNQHIQIVGTVDPMFYFKDIERPDYTIKDGGHFMIFEDAQKVAIILAKELEH
jgi:pimeloyl-ACP methyl ester carboxylesterase